MSLLTLFTATAALAQVDRNVVTKRKTEGFLGKFKSSMFATSISMGSGTFYQKEGTFPGHDGADNAYIGQDFTFLPRFNVAKAQSIRLNFALECEYTQPDRNPGRACNQSDIRLSYHHNNLWQDPLLSGTFFGYGGIYIPVSYGSLNNNTITNVRLVGGYLVNFFNDKLALSYSFGVQKYIPRTRVRDANITGGSISSADAASGATGSASRMNDNWLLVNSFSTGFYFNSQWSVSLSLTVMNFFRYSVTEDQFSVDGLPTMGRADATWGALEGTYKPLDYLSVSLGVSSYQPALTSRGKLRFPFYDFITPQDNYTKWYLSAAVMY